MIRLLNQILRVFGSMGDGSARVYVHWQNLNEKEDGEPAGLPWHGRAWLRLGPQITLRFEWNLWSRFAHAQVGVDPNDGEVVVGLALPPISLWWGIEGIRRLYRMKSRELGWSFHGWTLFWHGWTDPNEWRSGTPWWRYCTFNLLNILLGKSDYHSMELGSEVVAVPMPEGPYAGRATLEEHVWKRRRVPFSIRKRYVRLNMVHGIPDGSDKGDIRESSHEAKTVDAALVAFLAYVLRRRRRNRCQIEAVICEGCRAATTVRALAGTIGKSF